MYTLVKQRRYWAHIKRNGRLSATCHRTTLNTWAIFTGAKKKKGVGEEYESLQKAFDAFILLKAKKR